MNYFVTLWRISKLNTMGKLKKKIMLLTTALFFGTNMAVAQTDKVVEELNKRGFWSPFARCLESDGDMESFLHEMPDRSAASLRRTLESLAQDRDRAQELLTARDEIGGKKKGKKLDARLAKRFTDVERAKEAFEKAEQVMRRYEILSEAINRELAVAASRTMPAGPLQSFYYSLSNGFAGFRHEVSLSREEDGKRLLKINEERLRMPEEERPKPICVEVEDSVFVRVRDMVEEGKLYDIGRYYRPDFDIMDASGWSLSIYFEGGNISSGGYAEGPDHGDTLSAILKYLNQLAESLSGKEKAE